MKMVGVSRVVLWPQRVTEVMATAAQQRRQPGARSLAPPALQDANASTVRQTETADVQRVRRGVFTAPRLLTMVNIAAGKAAEMIESDADRSPSAAGSAASPAARCTARCSAPAGSWRETTAQLHRAKIRHPHHVTQRAASLAVGHRPAGDKPPAIGFRQQGGALVCRQPAQLKRRQPARGSSSASGASGFRCGGRLRYPNRPAPSSPASTSSVFPLTPTPVN